MPPANIPCLNIKGLKYARDLNLLVRWHPLVQLVDRQTQAFQIVYIEKYELVEVYNIRLSTGGWFRVDNDGHSIYNKDPMFVFEPFQQAVGSPPSAPGAIYRAIYSIHLPPYDVIDEIVEVIRCRSWKSLSSAQ